LLALAFVACATTPLKWESGIKPLSFDLWDVHCPSGLRVIFERAPGTQTAAIAAVVGSGAVEDPPGREGLAHLVEHLTFRTHAPDEPALWPRLWALGASFNASTDFETTTYHELFPATRLADAVAAEGRRLADPLAGVDEPVFAVERDVVRNELRERNETHSFGAAWAGAFRAAFPESHPFHRDLAGSHESTSALTLADARAYVRAHYRPDNITMVIVGDMELSQVETFVRALLPPALYGDPAHPRPVPPPPRAPTAPPEPPAARTLHRERAPVPAPELWIAWPLPGGFGRELRIAEMWSWLTGSNFYWGRFKNDDIAHVNLVSWPGVEASLFICRVQLTKGDHPEEVLREVVKELPWIGGDEVYLDERVRNMKLGLLRDLAFNAESPVERALERAAYAHRAGGASAYGPMIEQIQSITGDQAREFAERYLGADRARAVFIEPLADDAQPPRPIPAAQDLETLTGKQPLPPETWENLARVKHLAGLRRVTLDNGLEVVAVPRPGASVVTAQLAFHVDRTTTVTGIDQAADVARELRLEESPGDYGIGFGVDFGDDLATFTVRAGAANLPRALEMISFGARSLTVDWPNDKFREVRAPLWRRLEAQPEVRGDRAVWRAMFGVDGERRPAGERLARRRGRRPARRRRRRGARRPLAARRTKGRPRGPRRRPPADGGPRPRRARRKQRRDRDTPAGRLAGRDRAPLPPAARRPRPERRLRRARRRRGRVADGRPAPPVRLDLRRAHLGDDLARGHLLPAHPGERGQRAPPRRVARAARPLADLRHRRRARRRRAPRARLGHGGPAPVLRDVAGRAARARVAMERGLAARHDRRVPGRGRQGDARRDRRRRARLRGQPRPRHHGRRGRHPRRARLARSASGRAGAGRAPRAGAGRATRGGARGVTRAVKARCAPRG
jgi:zinc protease